MATILPRAPITYGIATVGGWKPERAQVGRARRVMVAEQIPVAAGPTAGLAMEPAIPLGDFAGLDA